MKVLTVPAATVAAVRSLLLVGLMSVATPVTVEAAARDSDRARSGERVIEEILVTGTKREASART